MVSSQFIKKLILIGTLSFCTKGHTGSLDGDLNISFESVGVEAAFLDGVNVDIPAGVIVIAPEFDIPFGYRLRIRVDNNAVFSDAAYVLEQSTGGAVTGNINQFSLVTNQPSGSSEIEFRVADPLGINGTNEYLLSGSTVVNSEVNFHVPNLQSGSTISISGEIEDIIGIRENLEKVKLFEYFDEFSGVVSTLADATIDRLTQRVLFTNGQSSDSVVLSFNDIGVDNGTQLGKRDVVDIMLSGNMDGISEILLDTDGKVRESFSIDRELNIATVRVRASDVFAAASTTLTTQISTNDKLISRRFIVEAGLSLLNSHDKTMIESKTNAGVWSYDGFEAKSLMLTNESSGITNYVFVNESVFDSLVEADLMWSKDGIAQSNVTVDVGAIPARGMLTIFHSELLEVLPDTEGELEVFVTFTATGQANQIHLVAESVTSDGRLSLPIYYNSGSSSFRTLLN